MDMFKKIIPLIILIAVLILTPMLRQQENSGDIKGEKEEKSNVEEKNEEKKSILGYCPTFEKYAFNLAKDNNFDLKRFESSNEVLSNLKFNNIDYGVIGRRAYSFEIDDKILEIPLEEYGFTLISPVKVFIEYSKLKDLEIHTYLKKESVEDFLGSEYNIIFHQNIEKALEKEIVLIHWEDFQDNFELFIPIETNQKVEKFRTPILYTREKPQNINSL
jgi:hypothetical protein